MCGKSWLATKDLQPTAPVLKAGHPGVPCYNYMYVCLSVSWLGGLPFFSSYASVLSTCISMNTYSLDNTCTCTWFIAYTCTCTEKPTCMCLRGTL